MKAYVDGVEVSDANIITVNGHKPRIQWLPRWLSWLPGYWLNYQYRVSQLPFAPPAGSAVVIVYEYIDAESSDAESETKGREDATR